MFFSAFLVKTDAKSKTLTSSKGTEQLGFPDSSVGKESTCNAGDSGSIPGSGRSPGEGKGYPLQCSCIENSMDSPWGCKESDTTEPLSLSKEQLQCRPQYITAQTSFCFL